MSEQLQPKPDRIPERKPFHRVEWNGSVAEIYDSAPMLDAPASEVYVYDRSDFQTPIERTQISVQKVDLEGEVGTALTARIRLDRTRSDYVRGNGLAQPLLSAFLRNKLGMNDFIPYRNVDKDLTIEPTVFNNVHRISYTGGGKFLVWVDGDKKLITVSNNLSLSSTNAQGEQKNQVVVTPQVDGTLDPTTALDGFLKAFMRTIDYTAGLTSYRPGDARLKRSYAIGQEIKDARPARPASNIGRSALGGSQPSGTQRKDTHKTMEQRSSLTEDLPEIEIVESKLTLDDVGGLEQVKKTLRDIAISFQHPEVMEKWGATRPQGVLMYGEPGTGKTMLAQALATEMEAEMWAIQSTDIYEKWLGNSESHIKDIFSRARQHEGRLILFFDEFDSIVGITESPDSGGATARNAVAGIFKQEMNTLAKDNPDVLVVAATNNLDRIDPALIRSGRFDHKVYIPMPDEEARQQIIAGVAAKSMLQQESEGFKVFDDDLNIVKLASETDGMSGADISEIFRRLGLSRAMQEARTGQQQPPISQDEIEQEIRRFRTAG